tara:strand:- start:2374 stop:2805 length:432 start_codon:yes stop_codon:yes gene_type:complete
MAFFTGRTGSLVFGGKPVAKIRDWSLDTTVELLSTNTIESTSNTFTPGVKGATGSATLMYYKLESGESASFTQFTALLSKIMKTGSIETTQRVSLELNVGGATADDVIFNAYITSANVSVSTGELTVVPITFTVDGDFTQVIS